MSLKLACPRCHHVQFFDDAFAGQPVTCAKCLQAFRVPRQAEPTEEQASTPVAPVTVAPSSWTGQLNARALPTSFAPAEPLAVKVVELPDISPDRSADDSIHRSASTATDEPFRLEPRGRVRARSRIDEPSKLPWTFGVSAIAFLLLLFGATAAWFLMREHRPQQQRVFVNNQPFPPQQFQPQFQQPQFQPNMPMPQGQGMQMPGQAWPRLQKGQIVSVRPLGNEQFIEIKLVKGEVKVQGTIALNDPSDPLSPGCHRKVYLIELEANRKYTIEMNADPPRALGGQLGPGILDPFLMIQDSQGKILDWNDDIAEAFNLDSRIQIRIPAKGKYRIIATSFGVNESGNFFLTVRDDSGGKLVAANKLPQRELPTPAKQGQALNVVQEKHPNLVITTILESEPPLVGDLCWAPGGKAFFALDSQGTLRRIAWPENIEEFRLETKLSASSLALSRAGLLVSYPELEEVWVIDPDTLKVKKQISAPGVQRVTATPATDIAFAAVKYKAAPPPKVVPPFPQGGVIFPQPANVKPQPTDGIMVLNAASAVPVRQYDQYSPKHLTVTPNGKYLFAEGNIERLLRYRVQGDKGDELIFDEQSQQLAGQGQGIFVSPDSKYVCLTSPGGNYTTDPKVKLQQYTTLIFKTNDLKKDALRIETGESPRIVGFDPKAVAVIAHNNEKQIMLFSETGVKKLQENLPGEDRLAVAPRQFLPHAAGFRMLVRTEKGVYGVEFLKEEEK